MTIENVAILFTDIVGSTELSQRLTPDAADELRRGHFSILRQALAEAGGTEVKNLGDGLMVVFASASAALSCAVTMQQGVESDNRSREHPVGLRVGLSGGEVSREDDDYFGDPVVEAARLCAICDGGQVLAADLIRAIAGRRARHRYRALGELDLKGLPDPVEAVEVLWEPLGEAETKSSIPLPRRLAPRPAVGVVGRQVETAFIADAAKRVAGGEGRELLLVSGEAGEGKTTVMAEAARAAFENGACVLFGHCEEELATPYQLFAEALGHYVTHAPEDQLRTHVDVHGAELSRLVPALASRIPDLPPSKSTDTDSERFLLFAAVVGLLSTVSTQQPVVLVFDDLQWADKGSLLLLQHLSGAEPNIRVLVLAAYRDTELPQAHVLRDSLGVLRRHSGVSGLSLTGLDNDGVLSFLEAAAGQILDAAGVGLAHALHRETDGNPFFVSEVLRHLAETGAVYRDADGRWVTGGPLERIALPDSVREVIGGRVVRLGPEAGRVLSLAAVIGRDFDLDLLGRTTATTEDELLDILEAAAAAALVRELADAPGHYSFAHALIQHTLYEEMGVTRRARAHRQVAQALEDLCGDRPGPRVGALARHWFHAGQPADPAKAIRYSRQAGDAALAALAPADALQYYAQALDLYPQTSDPEPVLGIDLAIGLGTAQRQTGDAAFRETLLGAAGRAADMGDTERLVAAALANNRGFFSSTGGIDAERVAFLELALDRLPPDHPTRALVLATLCAELAYGSTLDHRQALADEALAIAERTGDDAARVRVLNLVSYPLSMPSLLEQSLACTNDALVRAERLGDPVLTFLAAGWRTEVAARAGDIEEMDRCMQRAGALADQLDQPSLHWLHTYRRATRALIAGDADRAEQLATEALQFGNDSGQPDAMMLYGGQLMFVHMQRGTLSDLVPLIEQMEADTHDVAPGMIAGVLAMAHVEGNRTDEARLVLNRLEAADFTLGPDPVWLTGMVSYAEAAIECGDPRYARPLFDQLVPFADQLSTLGGISAEGPVSHFVGGLATVLGRHDQADAYFAQAAAASARMGAKFFAARTDLSWGTLLAARQAPGDVERARQLLASAHNAATANGYAVVVRRADAVRQRL